MSSPLPKSAKPVSQSQIQNRLLRRVSEIWNMPLNVELGFTKDESDISQTICIM